MNLLIPKFTRTLMDEQTAPLVNISDIMFTITTMKEAFKVKHGTSSEPAQHNVH